MNDSQQTSKQIVTIDVLAMKYWAPALLSFTTSKPHGFTYSAVQYSRLTLNVDGKMPDQLDDFEHYVVWKSSDD